MTGVPVHPDGDTSLRRLKSQAAKVFLDSQEAMRQSVILRFNCLHLRRAVEAGHHIPAPVRGIERGAPVPQMLLTPRELAVLKMVVEGKTTRAIASELRISFKTAASHRANIMLKLNAPNAAAVVREAFRLGLV